MIELPDFEKSFEYENNFYFSCASQRIGKLLAHYELYKLIRSLPGEIIECGIFKGSSFLRFAMFRELFGDTTSKRMIGFDVFDKFPETEFYEDKELRQEFINTAGEQGISMEQLMDILKHKGVEKQVELVQGDILKTVPSYVRLHPDLQISLLNLDTDIYEPAVTILEHLYPRIVKGGILIMDDYDVFPGETKAVNDYFKDKNIKIQKFSFSSTPCYIIKS